MAIVKPLSVPSSNQSFVRYDDHTQPHRGTTVPQLTLFVLWLAAIFIRMTRRFTKMNLLSQLWSVVQQRRGTGRAPEDVASKGLLLSCTPISVTSNSTNPAAETRSDVESGVGQRSVSDSSSDQNRTTTKNGRCGRTTTGSVSTTNVTRQNFSPIIPPPTIDQFLHQIILLGVIMIYFYMCDYRKIFPLGERVYKRDTFLFVLFIFFFVGSVCTLRPTNDKILNRDQTEEWKGWMQVLFVWYHYFVAKEWYKWIRIYIACYVWMTGFGNFSFFWVRQDFSAWRSAKMLFRLDFLVLIICLTVSNAYMIYYICAMHTYWFLSVYALMGVFSSWNKHRVLMALKLVTYAVVNGVIFDVPMVAGAVFRPLSFVLGLADNSTDDLHEWVFRAGLDHWICYVGLLSAYLYPNWETFIKFLEGDFNSRHYCGVIGRGDLAKLGVLVVLLIILGAWFLLVLPLEKYMYNRVHPYTSWIPIMVYVISRNLWPALRVRYVHLFAWLGKITLETYLSQLHIYLQSNAKHLITYIVGYPFMNFSLATIIYLIASYQLFHITTELSAFLIPTDRRLMLRNIGIVFMGVTGSLVLCFTLRFSDIA